jgi:hypothetical protein
VYEVYQLECLCLLQGQHAAADEPNGNGNDNLEDLEKRYRLAVKKRLNKVHREEFLGACRNKEEMKAALGKLYDETLQGYRVILASVQRQQRAKHKSVSLFDCQVVIMFMHARGSIRS